MASQHGGVCGRVPCFGRRHTRRDTPPTIMEAESVKRRTHFFKQGVVQLPGLEGNWERPLMGHSDGDHLRLSCRIPVTTSLRLSDLR